VHHPAANPPDLKAVAFRIIASNEPKTGRALHAELVFTYGYHPKKVTSTLQGMVESREIASHRLDRRGAIKPLLYTTGRELKSKEWKQLHKLYDLRDEWLPNWLIGQAGERYVRGLFVASNRFGEVTQRERLGTIVDKKKKNAADVMVTDRETGERYMVSVKNRREFVFPHNSAFPDCVEMAKGHRAHPWLFVPYAVPRAMEQCKAERIRLTVLGRQIVPAEDPKKQYMWWVLRELEPIFGPQPFEIAYAKMRETLKRSEAAQRDLQMLNDGVDSLSDW